MCEGYVEDSSAEQDWCLVHLHGTSDVGSRERIISCVMSTFLLSKIRKFNIFFHVQERSAPRPGHTTGAEIKLRNSDATRS